MLALLFLLVAAITCSWVYFMWLTPAEREDARIVVGAIVAHVKSLVAAAIAHFGK